jgi:chlorophyll(ide) b reductase
MRSALSDEAAAAGLLLSGATPANKRAFNILCEQPETIAAYLAPRMRTVVARDGRQQYIRYLTPGRALWFLLMAPLRIRRYFDDEGNSASGIWPDLGSSIQSHDP